MANLTFDQKLRRLGARILMPGGFVVIGLALGMMVIFRHLGIIQTPWLIVLAPLWFPFALRIVLGVAVFALLVLYLVLKNSRFT